MIDRTDRPRGILALTVAPDPTHVSTVRAFAAAIGRDLDLDQERIEDLKLIFTEICAIASEATTGVPLTLEVEEGPDGFVIRCTGAGPPPGRETEQGEHRDRLMHALAPDLRWGEDGAVRFEG